MQHWVVLTVGRNPLPCLVQAYRICKLVRQVTGQLPRFLVFSEQEAREADMVRTTLTDRLRADEKGGPITLDWQQALIPDQEPYDPKAVGQIGAQAFKRIVNPPLIYYAYTGETKAMSLHLFKKLEEKFRDTDVLPISTNVLTGYGQTTTRFCPSLTARMSVRHGHCG